MGVVVRVAAHQKGADRTRIITSSSISSIVAGQFATSHNGRGASTDGFGAQAQSLLLLLLLLLLMMMLLLQHS